MKPKHIIVLFFVVFISFTISCNSQDKMPKSKSNPIVGRWYSFQQPNEFIEFFQDNTMQIKEDDNKNKNTTGTWLLLDDGRVKIQTNGLMGDKPIYFGKIQMNKLVLDIAPQDSFLKMPEKYTNYFPLEPGYKNYLLIETTTDNQKKSEKITLTVLPQQVVEGTLVTPVVRIESETGKELSRQFFIKDSEGIAIVPSVGSKASLSEIIYLFKYPFIVGRSWDDNRGTHRYESTTEKIIIDGTTYENCLKKKFVSIDGITTMGGEKLTFQDTAWYAPGIGIIKAIHERITPSRHVHIETYMIKK